jgi:hypothetical protein
MKKSVAAIIAVFLCVFILSGCVESVKTPEQDKLMEDIFNSIENEDYDTAKELMSGLISESDLDNALPQIAGYVKGTIKEYKKIGYYYHVSLNNDEKINTQTFTYNVKTDYDNYIIEMVLLQKGESDWSVYGYNVTKASESTAVSGSVIDFSNFDFFQLLLLLFSAGCLALIIVAIVKCAKSPIRRKALWIVLIILLQVGFSIAQSPSRFDISTMLFLGMSSLYKYTNGGYALSVIIPLGAVLFLCLKKRLINSAEAYRLRQEVSNTPPSPQPFIEQKDVNETTDALAQSENESGSPIDENSDK